MSGFFYVKDEVKFMYDISYISEAETEGIFSAIMAAIGAYSAIIAIIGVIMIVAMWKLFKKAGKPGWASLIPIYNTVVLFQISGLNPWLILLFIIPGVNVILMIIAYVNLAKAFGRGTGFAVGLILLPVIFLPVLAFGKDEYQGAQ